MKKLLLLIFVAIISCIGLTTLPVFSDEAIYIRWAQVATNDPQRYLFLSMLDGKPPLHVWSLMPILQVVSDPLLAGRLMSVVFGLIALVFVGSIVKQLGGSKKEELWAMVFLALSPFWFFHFRLALADTLLTLFFVMCISFGLRVIEGKHSLLYSILFGIAFGGALGVKTSALFFVLPLALLPLVARTTHKKTQAQFLQIYKHPATLYLAAGGVLGGLLFLLLKFSPLFPTLFSRSEDYSLTVTQLLSGQWKRVLFSNVPGAIGWFVWYLSPFVLVLAAVGKKRNPWLIMMGLLYALPLLVFGKVVYSRYYLPITPIAAILAAFGLHTLLTREKTQLVGKGLVALFLLSSTMWIVLAWFNPGYLPLARTDTQQYLTSWSSGYGIPEIRAFMLNEMKQQQGLIEVGTEGYFGTLPDGLQIYFNRPEFSGKISIDGQGQPIHAISDNLRESAKTRPTYLVVNADRLFVNDPDHVEVVKSYPRPRGGAPLLLLRIHP